MLYVAHDAHDLPGPGSSESQAPANRILAIWPVAARQAVVDDHYRRPVSTVCFGQKASLDERNPQHTKVICAHRTIVGWQVLSRRQRRAPVDPEGQPGCFGIIERKNI